MRRRRQCKSCRHRFTTFEIVSPDEETDREKVRMRNAITLAMQVLNKGLEKRQ